jgi:hypothetical protein
MQVKDTLIGASKSFTIWFNGLVLAALPVLDYAAGVLPQLQQYIGPETYKLAGLVVIIGNILLRFKTNTPLADK